MAREEMTTREVNDRLKAAEKNTSGRFKTVTEQIKRLDNSINTRAKTILEKQISRLEKLNNLVLLDKHITEMENRLEYVGERMRLLIHKETILTELSRYARDKGDYLQLAQFHYAIMRAYNQPDDWWGSTGHELMINEWYERIMKLLEE